MPQIPTLNLDLRKSPNAKRAKMVAEIRCEHIDSDGEMFVEIEAESGTTMADFYMTPDQIRELHAYLTTQVNSLNELGK